MMTHDNAVREPFVAQAKRCASDHHKIIVCGCCGISFCFDCNEVPMHDFVRFCPTCVVEGCEDDCECACCEEERKAEQESDQFDVRNQIIQALRERGWDVKRSLSSNSLYAERNCVTVRISDHGRSLRAREEFVAPDYSISIDAFDEYGCQDVIFEIEEIEEKESNRKED